MHYKLYISVLYIPFIAKHANPALYHQLPRLLKLFSQESAFLWLPITKNFSEKPQWSSKSIKMVMLLLSSNLSSVPRSHWRWKSLSGISFLFLFLSYSSCFCTPAPMIFSDWPRTPVAGPLQVLFQVLWPMTHMGIRSLFQHDTIGAIVMAHPFQRSPFAQSWLPSFSEILTGLICFWFMQLHFLCHQVFVVLFLPLFNTI